MSGIEKKMIRLVTNAMLVTKSTLVVGLGLVELGA